MHQHAQGRARDGDERGESPTQQEWGRDGARLYESATRVVKKLNASKLSGAGDLLGNPGYPN